MSEEETRRPHDRDREPEDRPEDQEEVERASRFGGDAEAAASPEDREALARDDDDTWGEDDAASD